jgi:hypothetical protein
MEVKDNSLERMCKIYLNLTDDDKEKIIMLGEGLLKSQNIISDEVSYLSERKENIDLDVV